MGRSAGEQAEKLLARNQQIYAKIYYFEMKLQKLRQEEAANKAKAAELLKQERKARKYKVD